MHDPRTSTALRRLGELTAEPFAGAPWVWAVTRSDAKGRLPLPPAARAVLGTTQIGQRWLRLALILEPDPAGIDALDGRGRLVLPPWLRLRGDAFLIGARRDLRLVLVASTSVLDGLGDVLVGTGR